MSFSSAAVEAEACRRFNEEQNAARVIALEASRRAEAERLRLIEAQREDRVRRESEQIQARLRAEDAEREARRVAEQEAFEAAVKQQVASLKSRPLEERLRSEIEELRHAISCLSMKVSCPPPVPQLPCGYSEMQAKVDALSSTPWSKTLDDLKAFATLPAREVSILASPYKLGAPVNTFPQHGNQVYATIAHSWTTLEVSYLLIPQNTYGPPGEHRVLSIPIHSVKTISVPKSMKVFIISAIWTTNGNHGNEITPYMKATGIESQ